MPISFLAPLFLAGLAAIAIPIIIHLSHRTKKEPIRFPSLMFVSQVPFRTARKQRIRNWLLFLLRTAAIVIVVMAFSRPLFDSETIGGPALAGAREVVILLDRSYSMAYGDRWERAREAAREAIVGLGPEDRGTFVLFDDRAEAMNQPTRDRASLLAALEQATLRVGTTRYASALELAAQFLEDSKLPHREAVLITDFQMTGWDREERITLPEGTVLTRVNVADDEPSNVTVTDVTLERRYRSGRELVGVLARLANRGWQSVDELRVALEIDGQEAATQSVSLEANSATVVRFASFVLPQRSVRGVVRSTEDQLSVDDAFNFVLNPGKVVTVLVLNPPNASADEGVYIRRALELSSQPPFQVDVKRVTQLRSADLNGRSVVILNDAPFPSGSSAGALRKFVASGGGLLVILGQHTSASSWPAAAAELLPGRVGAPIDRLSDRGGTMSVVDYDHPIFDLFRAPRSGDFSQARFFRYRRITNVEGWNVLARFDDGTFAVGELSDTGRRVIAVGSGWANSWNDLPLQPVFLPFTHQVVRHLAGYVAPASWLTAGQVLPPSQYPAQAASADEVVIETPQGSRIVTSMESDSAYVELSEAGFYTFRQVGGRGAVLGTIAVNPDVTESDLSALDPEELASAVMSAGVGGSEERLAALLTPSEKERRQRLWWYLLVAALLILVAETAVANRSRRRIRAP